MPRPPADIDPDWLRERFTKPGATAREIAAEIGHHPSTVSSHAPARDSAAGTVA